MTRLSLMILCGYLTSCNAYKSDFDCKPGEGVPCASVHEIEAMIIESKDGPNIFVHQSLDGESKLVKSCDGKIHLKHKRIWVAPQWNNQMEFVEGHYIYLPE
jgi:hypothetical protein